MNWSNWCLTAKPGDLVVFLGANGQDHELHLARTILSTNHIYTVKDVAVGGWRTILELEEHPGHVFNSVMFNPAPNGIDRAIRKLP